MAAEEEREARLAPRTAGRPGLAAIVLALALGGLGGYGAYSLALPLPWMIGSLLVTTLASLAGAPIAMAMSLRTAMVVVLGVMLGSGFTPEILASLGRWAPSLGAVALYIFITTALGSLYFRRLCGHDRVTAYFSAAPGGLSEMVLVGTEMGGDGRIISLMHAARILLVVMTLPLALRLVEGIAPAARTAGPSLGEVAPLDLGLLALAGIVGFYLARALKVPAAAVVGPMLLSALVHLAGLTQAAPPREAVAAAQVAVGAALGARFAGTALTLVARALLQAAGATLLLLAVTLVFAFLLDLLLDLGFEPLLLAFAPGGLAEMSLIAIALGSSPAFVATHHILRIFLIVVAAPLVFRLGGSSRNT